MQPALAGFVNSARSFRGGRARLHGFVHGVLHGQASLSVLHRAWSRDIVRLSLLTLYYLAIIVALIILYGGTTYTPPPFVYQGF